ncbi:hypothetical protein F5887DRAFT_1081261 [Amanita rubescens]|nr:hypothetical protein F5887DRAFT_1081261 [Amanita rubescens]
MRPSIFTLFFIVISTTWASLENDDTIAISKRESSPPPSPPPPPPYSSSHRQPSSLRSHSSRLIESIPPTLPPSYASLPRVAMPPRSLIEIMRKAWEVRDQNRKLAGGVLDPVFKLRWDSRNGDPVLMRKRTIIRKKDFDTLEREVNYLVKLGRFVAWSMEESPRAVCPDAYVAMLDKNYVSGKDTKLPKKELEKLRKAARDRRGDMN